ncbi:MAG: MFS transporter [Acidibacillus sp.]|nr:MFS transporter [Acidibacillus sp.]
MSLSYLLAFMQRTGPGVISNTLQRQFHVTAAVLGTLSSIQYFLYMVMQIPVGISGDKFGPERLLAVGVLLDGTGTVIFSLAHTFAWLLAGRAIVGLGDSLIWVNIVLILGRYFKPQVFGTMLAVTSTAGNFGALLTTIPFAALTMAIGWRLPFFSLGIAMVVVAALNYVVLRYAKSHLLAKNELHMERTPVRATLHVVVKDRNAWATFACHFGAVGTYIGFMGLWAVPYIIDTYHLSEMGSTVFTLIAFIGALIGSPLAGMISDRLGSRKRPYIVTQVLTTLAWLSIPLFGGKPPLIVVGIAFGLIGLGSGASLLTFAVVRDQTPKRRVGITSGFANTGGFLSAVLLPVLYGTVLDMVGGNGRQSTGAHPHAFSFALAFLVPTLFSAIGVVGSLSIKERHAFGEQDELESDVDPSTGRV